MSSVGFKNEYYVFLPVAVELHDFDDSKSYPAVIIQKSNSYEALLPRNDLFQYSGNFSWGYRGTGVQSLAWAIAADLFGQEANSIHKEHILDRLEMLDMLSVHVLAKAYFYQESDQIIN